MRFVIRRVSINDLNQLQKIAKKTFFDTFSSKNSLENMKEYLKTGFSMEKLKEELNNTNSRFYFAECQDKAIGYLKINLGKSQTDKKNENSLEIERIYVLKEFHGTNAGQVLFEKAVEISKQEKVDYLWLGAWEENPRAIQFYKKNGFVEFDKHIFKLGGDEQIDLLMKLELNT